MIKESITPLPIHVPCGYLKILSPKRTPMVPSPLPKRTPVVSPVSHKSFYVFFFPLPFPFFPLPPATCISTTSSPCACSC